MWFAICVQNFMNCWEFGNNIEKKSNLQSFYIQIEISILLRNFKRWLGDEKIFMLTDNDGN